MTTNLVAWGGYAVFVAGVLYAHREQGLFDFSGPVGALKLVVWVALVVFLAYSLHCSRRENFFRSLRKITALHWGRQIGADLYLGLFLALVVVYLNEGAMAALLWAVPTLLFANLSILLYFAVHFDSIVEKLTGL